MYRCAEKCHDSVPDVFVDYASIGSNAFFQAREIFVQKRDDFFRRHILGKTCKSTDIAEHHGNIPSLSSKRNVSAQKIIPDLGRYNLSESVPHELLFLERFCHGVESVAEHAHLIVGADYSFYAVVSL